MSSGSQNNSGSFPGGDFTFDSSAPCDQNKCDLTLHINVTALPIQQAALTVSQALTNSAVAANSGLTAAEQGVANQYLGAIQQATAPLVSAGQSLVNQVGQAQEGPSGVVLSLSPTQTTPGGVTQFLQPDGTYSTIPALNADGTVYTGGQTTTPIPPVNVTGPSYTNNPDGTITVTPAEGAPYTTAAPDVPQITIPGVTQSPNPDLTIPTTPQSPNNIPVLPKQPAPYCCIPVTPNPNKPTPPPTSAWAGYCNPQTNVWIVRPFTAASPGAPWQVVSLAADQATAAKEAAAACSSNNPPPPPPQFKPPVYPPTWRSDNCDTSIFRTPEKLDSFFGNAVNSQLFAYLYNQAGTFFDSILGGVDDEDTGGCIKAVGKALGTKQIAQAAVAIPAVASLLGCTDGNFIAGLEQLASLRYWQEQAGVPIDQFALPYKYALNALCTTKQLSPDQALAAYLANQLSHDDLSTLWAIDGNCPQNLQPMLQASRAKPVPGQLDILRKRQIIAPDDYTAYMRQLGYIDPSYSELVYKSGLPIPALGESVAIASRGADNADIASKYGLDNHFSELVGGDTQSWMQSHGYQPDHIRDAWRQHWQVPGFGVLSEIWYRCRRKISPNDTPIEFGDITQAMTLLGIPDYWSGWLQKIIYRPLPLRYARNAYVNGAISDARMLQVFTDVGLSDADAEKLFDGQKTLKLQQLTSSEPIKEWLAWFIDGPTCISRLQDYAVIGDDAATVMRYAEKGFIKSAQCRAFTDGVFDGVQLRAALKQQGVTDNGANAIISELGYNVKTTVSIERYKLGLMTRDATIQACESYAIQPARYNAILDALDAERQLQLSAKCINGIRRQFILGAITPAQAQANLAQIGVVLERVNEIFAGWQCEMNTRSRQVSVNTLCSWLATGKISQPNMFARLQNLGYTNEDAINILSDCVAANNLKQEKIAQRTAQQQAAAAAKAAAAQRRTAAAQQKQLATLEKARVAALKARVNIQKMLVTAAGYLSKAGKGSVADSTAAVVQAFYDLQSKYGLSQINAISIIIPIAEKYTGPSLADFVSQVDAAAETSVQASSNLAGQEISETSISGAPTQPQSSDLGPPLLPS